MAEFQVVSRKRKNKHHRKAKIDQSLTERIRNLKSDLKVTDFFTRCINIIQNTLKVDTDKPGLNEGDFGQQMGLVGAHTRETNSVQSKLTESVEELQLRDGATSILDKVLEEGETAKHSLDEVVDGVNDPDNESCKGLNNAGKERIHDVVCYGLGNFSDSYIARYQLAFLLLVIEEMDISLCNCHIFDPKFNDEEIMILQNLGLNIIQENEVAKRKCSKSTLFYMPHCGKSLYNNLLWANWGINLDDVVIIGNSFTRMVESTPQRILDKTGHYILKIQPYMTEKELPSTEKFEDVFNDTVIHIFNDLNSKVAEDFWEDNIEPQYDDCDPEIIFSWSH